RPEVGHRLAEHSALHAAVRPHGGGVAGAHHRAIPGRAVGDRPRRPALRLPPAEGVALVRRRAAHRARCRVRDQTGAASRLSGNVSTVEYVRSAVTDAIAPYERDRIDMVAVRYTPRLADVVPDDVKDATFGQAGWSGYLAFDHHDPVTSKLELRLALARAVDR